MAAIGALSCYRRLPRRGQSREGSSKTQFPQNLCGMPSESAWAVRVSVHQSKEGSSRTPVPESLSQTLSDSSLDCYDLLAPDLGNSCAPCGGTWCCSLHYISQQRLTSPCNFCFGPLWQPLITMPLILHCFVKHSQVRPFPTARCACLVLMAAAAFKFVYCQDLQSSLLGAPLSCYLD